MSNRPTPRPNSRCRQLLWLSSLPVAIALLTPAAADAASFNRLFVFGDSLSDTGNTANATFGLIPPAQLPGIDLATNTVGLVSAYSEGRFADGLNYVDYLAPGLGAVSTTNFAFTSATTGTLNTVSPLLPGLQQQVNAFPSAGIDPTAADLFIVWAGSNDYLEIAGETDPNVPVGNLEVAIRTLAGKGAKTFLIPNLPDLGVTPLVSSRANASQVSQRVAQHNSLLADKLNQLSQDPSLSDVRLVPLDIAQLIDAAGRNPASFGFTNVTEACLSPSPLFFQPPSPVSRCANPDQYLFWDSLHPTSKAHQFVADEALAVLHADDPAAVPEPGLALALMLVGGAVVGSRRR